MEVAEIVSGKYKVPIETIEFPEHLKNKYQYLTRARKHFDHKFITVDQYVNLPQSR